MPTHEQTHTHIVAYFFTTFTHTHIAAYFFTTFPAFYLKLNYHLLIFSYTEIPFNYSFSHNLYIMKCIKLFSPFKGI